MIAHSLRRALAAIFLLALTVCGQFAAPTAAFASGSVAANARHRVIYDRRYGTSTDVKGWFTFGLHSGNRRVWLNTSGSDSNDCLSPATACATFDHTFPIFLGGSFNPADQLMVAGTAGRTYIDTIGSPTLGGHGGISAAYPTAILSYDPTDPTNTAKYGKLVGADMPVIQLTGGSFNNANCDGSSYYAIQGIAFDGLDQSAAGIAWQCTPTHNHVVWQNNRFNAVELAFDGSVAYDATGATYIQGGNVSKNAFYGQYAYDGNAAGLYVQRSKSFYIQDNVFIHAGHRIGSSRDDTLPNGGAHFLGHGDYVGALNNNAHLDRNFYADSAQDGYNSRGNGTGTSIASLDEPIAGNVGDFSGSFREAPDGVLNQTTDWLSMGGANINTSLPRGQGAWMTNGIAGSFIRNMAAFDNPKFGAGPDKLIVSYNGAYTFDTITHTGSTAIAYAAGGTGFAAGEHISIDHASPSEYNVTYQPITIIDSTHISFPLASTPATNATAVGVFTQQVPQYMLFDKVRAFNYATTLDGATPASNVASIIHNTWTNSITDALAPGAGNQVSSSGLFPNYKTRDQVITAVLNGIGITPSTANYYARKSQLLNAAAYRPDLPWAQWLIGVGLPSMGLRPSFLTPSYITYSDTPTAVYKGTPTDLTLTPSSFTRGTAVTAALTGTIANPVITSSDLPAGFSIIGTHVAYDASGSGSTTPTVHFVETSEDGTATHTTAIVLNIAGASFTPASVSGMDYWMEADPTKLFTDAGITNVTTNGDAVYQANDISTSDPRNVAQSTLVNRPTYVVGTGGKHNVKFDGSNDFLGSSGTHTWNDGSGQYWFAVSLKINSHSSGSGEHDVVKITSSSGGYIGKIYYIDNVIGLRTANSGGSDTIEASGASSDFTDGVPLVVIGTVTSSAAELFFNNVSPDGPTGLTGSRKSDGSQITISDASFASDVSIYGIVHGTGTLSSSDRAALQTYMANLHEFMPFGLIVAPCGWRRRRRKAVNDNEALKVAA
jgi:hypothetical protein